MTIQRFVKYFMEELAVLEWYDAREVRAMAGRVLEEVAGVPSYKIVVESQMELDDRMVTRLQGIVAELATGRPLQYVLGYEMFYGHKFCVGEGVLIPRPETEELVRMVVCDLQKMQGCAAVNGNSIRIMDICTGSGCIAWSVASAMGTLPVDGVATQGSKVWGCDISNDALSIATNQKIESSIVPHFFKCDILLESSLDIIVGSLANGNTSLPEQLSEEQKLDIIISNPPYVCEQERAQMRSNVLDFEPGCALFVPDDNPLLFYRRIAELGCSLLKKGGRIYFEANERFAQHTAKMLETVGFAECCVVDDLFGKPRFVTACYI